MQSSGQLEQDVTFREAECVNPDCAFEGVVDAIYDPEASTSDLWWTCPYCLLDQAYEFEIERRFK